MFLKWGKKIILRLPFLHFNLFLLLNNEDDDGSGTSVNDDNGSWATDEWRSGNDDGSWATASAGSSASSISGSSATSISPSSADDDNTLRVGVGDDEDDVNAKVFKLQLIIYPRQQEIETYVIS